MKHLKNILLLGCCLNMGFVFAQHTYTTKWFFGLGEIENVVDSVFFHNNGLRFQPAGFDTFSWHKQGPYFQRTNTQIVIDDSLLVYSNGKEVYNGKGQQIVDGDQLVEYIDSKGRANFNGVLFRGALLIPFSNSKTKFHLFHLAWKAFPVQVNTHLGGNTTISDLFYSVVDLELHNGQGGFSTLNEPIILDSMAIQNIVAIKHANGRDWWLLVHSCRGNTYYKILVADDRVASIAEQKIGGDITQGALQFGQLAFNKKGDKIAHAYQVDDYDPQSPTGTKAYLDVIDFNRCTGELGRAKTILSPTPLALNLATCFSPNGRFVYFASNFNAFQYDLWQDTIRLAYKVIQPSKWWLGSMQLAPNNKIVIEPWGSSTNLHYINYPDSVGTACDLRWEGIKLPSYQNGIPYTPDYGMGALAGSACDTLTSGIKPEERVYGFKIFPNPAKDNLNLIYLIGDNENLSVKVTNVLGQEVLSNKPLNASGKEVLATSELASGIYFLKIYERYNLLETKKFIVEH